MRPSVCLALVLALPSIALAQQQQLTPKQKEQEKQALAGLAKVQAQPLTTCPVGFQAKRSGSGQTIWTIAQEDAGKQDSASKRPSDVGVHVQLRTFQNENLKEVELSVAYLPAGVRYTPVQPEADTAHRKTFNLVAANSLAHQIQGDLLVGVAAGVTRVYLMHIVYADGTEWRPGKGKPCSVEPNGFTLVGAGK